MRKRKLLSLAKLKDLQDKRKKVPLSTLVRLTDLSISRAAVATLLRAYEEIESSTVRDSLAPVWVDQDITTAQEQPDNFVYIGNFPNGEWYEVN